MVSKDKLKISKQSSDVDFAQIINKLHDEQKQQDKDKMVRIKAKIMTVARFNLMLKNGRDNAEMLTKVKAMNPDGKLPMGTLFKT